VTSPTAGPPHRPTPPPAVASLRPCAFLDRDGTIVLDTGYLRDPCLVRLVPGAAAAIARLNRAGYPVVLVTNQAGISRGLLTAEEYFAVSQAMEALLANEGARLDATYVCPHAPERDGPCPCRKPALLHYECAARDFGLDTRRSWYVGDRLSDLLPARAFGAGDRALLVRTGYGAEQAPAARAAGFEAVADLGQAVERILAVPVGDGDARVV
jgi:D-glycero-D-manno-heptose 1,7-bisphosphate phosphatase